MMSYVLRARGWGARGERRVRCERERGAEAAARRRHAPTRPPPAPLPPSAAAVGWTQRRPGSGGAAGRRRVRAVTARAVAWRRDRGEQHRRAAPAVTPPRRVERVRSSTRRTCSPSWRRERLRAGGGAKKGERKQQKTGLAAARACELQVGARSNRKTQLLESVTQPSGRGRARKARHGPGFGAFALFGPEAAPGAGHFCACSSSASQTADRASREAAATRRGAQPRHNFPVLATAGARCPRPVKSIYDGASPGVLRPFGAVAAPCPRRGGVWEEAESTRACTGPPRRAAAA
jgi:hypothetical protein